MFKPGGAPRYKNGLIICGACAAAGGVVVLIWKTLYAAEDRKVRKATAHVGPYEPRDSPQAENDFSKEIHK